MEQNKRQHFGLNFFCSNEEDGNSTFERVVNSAKSKSCRRKKNKQGTIFQKTQIINSLNFSILNHSLYGPLSILFLILLLLLNIPILLFILLVLGCLTVLQRIHVSLHDYLYPKVPLIWSNQIVLITGGAQGVGKLLAETLVSRFPTVKKVVIWDVVDPSPSWKDPLDKILSFHCDVSSLESVQDAGRRVLREVGSPTILIK